MDPVNATVTGFLPGLAAGPACLLSWSPVLLPMVLTGRGQESGGRDTLELLALFLSGRLAAYLLVGPASITMGPCLEGRGAAVPCWATFILATSFYLLPTAFGSYLPKSRAFVGVGRVAALVSGGFFLLQCLAHLRH